MLATKWYSALVDQSVDDDLSEEVDLQGNFEFLNVIQPTLDGAHTATVHIAMESGGTYYPIYQLDNDTAADFQQITTGLATARSLIFRIGGAQFVKIVLGTGVTTNKTFYVRGFNRGG